MEPGEARALASELEALNFFYDEPAGSFAVDLIRDALVKVLLELAKHPK